MKCVQLYVDNCLESCNLPPDGKYEVISSQIELHSIVLCVKVHLIGQLV